MGDDTRSSASDLDESADQDLDGQPRRAPIPAESKFLLGAAMLIFVVTVVIGILNGLDVVDFGHNWIVTHVHAGTLGWITLAMMAVSFWMFAEPGVGDELGSEAEDSGTGGSMTSMRKLSIFSLVSIGAYVAAFAIGILWLRPVVGLFAIATSVAWLAWLISQARAGGMNVAKFGMIFTAAFLVIGGILGILLGLAMAGKFGLDGARFAGSHPASMVAGYLVLGGAAIAEWMFEPKGRRLRDSKAGIAQVILFFTAGVCLALGEILKVMAFLMINLPCMVAGIVIALVRLRKHLRQVRWTEPTWNRHVGLALVFLAINVGLVVYAIANYAEDFSKVPAWLIFSLDHAQFIGVVTNVFVAALLIANAKSDKGRPIADHAAFWGMNVGMAGFVVGILLESSPVKRIFAPVMGMAILIAIGANLARMRQLRGIRQSEQG